MSALDINKVIYFRYNLPWRLRYISYELQFKCLKEHNKTPREYCKSLIEFYNGEQNNPIQ